MWLMKAWNNYTYCTVKDIFTPQECQYIIDLSKDLLVEEAGVGDVKEVNHNIRKANVVWLQPNDEKIKNIYRKVCDAITTGNDQMYQFDLDFMEVLQFTEYKEGFFYSSHIDAGFESNYSRKLSFVLQLSDPNDYEGGDLVLYDATLDKPSIACKEQGSVTLFPSYTLHEVKPVTKGVRHSLVCWVNGPRFK